MYKFFRIIFWATNDWLMCHNEAMSDQNQLYIDIISQFPNPIWRAGIDTKCDYFNPAWLNFTGRTIKQELGNGWVEGVHKEDFDKCLKTYLDAFGKKQPFKMEYRLKHADGTYHWILDSGSPFFDDNDKFLGYIGSCYDINETKIHILKIESMNKIMIDRELRMIDLKKRVEQLEKALALKQPAG